MPQLVTPNGKLTDDGRALVAYMQAERDSMEPDAMPLDDPRRAYHAMVLINKQMSAEAFFTSYPHLSDSLWTNYMSSLPADDPRRARADAYNGEVHAAQRAQTAATTAARQQAIASAAKESAPPGETSAWLLESLDHRVSTPESAPQPVDMFDVIEATGVLLAQAKQANKPARLVEHGAITPLGHVAHKYIMHRLSEGISTATPYASDLRLYAAFVGKRLMPADQFLRENPTIQDGLLRWMLDDQLASVNKARQLIKSMQRTAR